MLDPQKIVAIARSYVGQEEIPPNAGFKDPAFAGKMIRAGFVKGDSWCAIFAKMVWLEAAGNDTALRSLIMRLLSPSALTTYYQCAHDGSFKVGDEPRPGAIVVFKHGTDPGGHLGHEGICTNGPGFFLSQGNYFNGFTSVEGNTTPNDPNARSGGITAEKTHELHLSPNPTGLNIIGFIYPS